MCINTINMNVQWTDKKLATFLVLFLLEIFFEGVQAVSSQEDVKRHLELGRDFLSRNQFADALTHYHAAVEGDPTNYLTIFKRATVLLALGKARNAVVDFSNVLEIKPDFTAAKIQRGTVYLKLGDFNNAEKDFFDVLQEDPHNDEVHYLYERINPAILQESQVFEIIKNEDYRTAIVLLSQLLEMSPWSVKFRESRAKCYIKDNDILMAVSDLRSANRLSQDSTDGYYLLSTLLYEIGHVADALKEVRECLKLDPEHSLALPFYKKIKKIDKFLTTAQTALDSNQWADCISSADRVLKVEEEISMVQFMAYQLLCTCHVKDEQYVAAIGKCRQALDLHRDPSVLCDRADALLETEMFDDAVHDYQDALAIDEHMQRAKDGIERARKMQKLSERRDYYKILNVKRSASKQEIVKAYRKAAQKWHPDAYKGDEKKMAEKKFIDVAAAKEVLTDPEKRKQFDMGEDPLDPESNQQGFRGSGSPFQHFQQGGSPFQFKFHFN